MHLLGMRAFGLWHSGRVSNMVLITVCSECGLARLALLPIPTSKRCREHLDPKAVGVCAMPQREKQSAPLKRREC